MGEMLPVGFEVVLNRFVEKGAAKMRGTVGRGRRDLGFFGKGGVLGPCCWMCGGKKKGFISTGGTLSAWSQGVFPTEKEKHEFRGIGDSRRCHWMSKRRGAGVGVRSQREAAIIKRG